LWGKWTSKSRNKNGQKWRINQRLQSLEHYAKNPAGVLIVGCCSVSNEAGGVLSEDEME
jgi:hypothetical protein